VKESTRPIDRNTGQRTRTKAGISPSAWATSATSTAVQRSWGLATPTSSITTAVPGRRTGRRFSKQAGASRRKNCLRRSPTSSEN